MIDHGLLSHDVDIPTDLVEGMCFSSKRNLQFAVMGWSIQNNVRYVPITSNKKNYTLRCAQHDRSKSSFYVHLVNSTFGSPCESPMVFLKKLRRMGLGGSVF